MNPGSYYHILQIGVTYEKGRQSGGMWLLHERSLLRDECALWKNLIGYAEMEYKQIDCSEKCFSDLKSICKKYDLPNYGKIIEKQDELVSSPDRFVVDDTKRNMIISRILELISEVEDCTKKINGKADAYRAMTRIHNLPGALHGIDALGGFPPVSPEEAMKYSES